MRPHLTLYARREPSRTHRRNYDILLYWDAEATRIQARYPYWSASRPERGEASHWVGTPEGSYLARLEWLPDVPRKGH
jgi:hypothetical protein